MKVDGYGLCIYQRSFMNMIVLERFKLWNPEETETGKTVYLQEALTWLRNYEQWASGKGSAYLKKSGTSAHNRTAYELGSRD